MYLYPPICLSFCLSPFFLTPLHSPSCPLLHRCNLFFSSSALFYLLLCLPLTSFSPRLFPSSIISSRFFSTKSPFIHHPSLWLSVLSLLFCSMPVFLLITKSRVCMCFYMSPTKCSEVRGTHYLCVDSLQPSQILISFSAPLLWGDTAEESKDLSIHSHANTHT